MYALYAFCREVDDIANDEASRSLKQALLLNWRSEIAHHFAGARVAAELGRALQLTTILRDPAEDAERHRLYLPCELLHRSDIEVCGSPSATPITASRLDRLPEGCSPR
jgi:phytoene/squalene synthetase